MEKENLAELAKLKEFEERISQGEKIEPGDWMPDEYRNQLIRMISQHAHSEVVGMLPEGVWITRAPNLRRKLVLLAKVQDEGGHGQYLYHAAETLGATREEMLDALLSGRAKYASVFNYPTLSWADIGIIGWLVDGAAIKNQTMLAQCSYGPYSRAMVRICAEEAFHMKQGKEMVMRYAQGTDELKKMTQDALDRWWWPTLMMFGLPDHVSTNSPVLKRWGIKTRSNDTLRQEFINELVPELHALDFTVPDGELHYNEVSGDWVSSEIDWDEFWRVVQGNGPCNKERLDTRRKAHRNGLWVREAVVAYARMMEKRSQL